MDATFFIVDNRMPNDGDGVKAAALIRKHMPRAKILGLSADKVAYGDINCKKNIGNKELVDIIIRA